MTRARFWAVLAIALSVVVVTGAVLVPIPFVSRSPGPVFDILGTNENKQVLVISGTKTHPTTGVLDMTTVAESGGTSGQITVGSALVGLFMPDTTVVPDDSAAEPGDREVQEAIFRDSTSGALGAAARYLDRPVRSYATVLQVVAGGASEGLLQTGDTVVAIDGKKIDTREDVSAAISGQPAGTTFAITVERDGKERVVEVTSRQDPDDPAKAVIGVLLDDQYRSDFKATVNLDNIGGPSAGLMLSIGMVDRLTPGDLLGGRTVAGTGTIDGQGQVGAIGGIDKKMIAAQQAGAELFLAPADNCPDVVGSQPDGLPVVPVATLTEAITALEDWRAGRPLPGCPRTGDE